LIWGIWRGVTEGEFNLRQSKEGKARKGAPMVSASFEKVQNLNEGTKGISPSERVESGEINIDDVISKLARGLEVLNKQSSVQGRQTWKRGARTK
jgi:hypothetical protein